MKERWTRWIKTILFHTPLRNAFIFHYKFMFSPAQLAFLCRCLDETAGLGGDIIEIGCASGHTTVFLNKHLDSLGTAKRYHCLDTFSGFTDKDAEYEKAHRSKTYAYDGFRANKRAWFEETLRVNGVTRGLVHQGDVSEFDFGRVGTLAFCLLDVDLYLPSKKALQELWPRMSEGGIVVVDDCVDGNVFDGAYQAYAELAAEWGLPRDIRLGKLGVLKKPSKT